MKKGPASIQIGKNGLTDNFILSIENAFKTRKAIKIRVLKSAGHDKEKIKEFAERIVFKLGEKYSYRIVGFSIFLKKKGK